MGNGGQGKAEKAVPTYTKIGWVVAWLVMLIIGGMILRNCATSIIYGRKTDAQQVEAYYKTGLADGTLGHGPVLRDEAVENPVLRKAYSKGYRDGLDRARQAAGSR